MSGSFSRYILLAGIILLLIGGVVFLLEKAGLRLGSMPGDIRFERNNTSCVVALGTSILLSIILTIILNLVARWMSK